MEYWDLFPLFVFDVSKQEEKLKLSWNHDWCNILGEYTRRNSSICSHYVRYVNSRVMIQSWVWLNNATGGIIFHINYALHKLANNIAFTYVHLSDLYASLQASELTEYEINKRNRLFGECVTCLDEIANMVQLPCKHKCCVDCVKKIDRFHMIRCEIRKSEIYKIYAWMNLKIIKSFWW